MADPVSITANVITVIQAATIIAKRISRSAGFISSNSDELSVLSNELQDLQIVLTCAEAALKEHPEISWPAEQASTFYILVQRTQDKLLSIESFLQGFAGESSDTASLLKSVEWAARGKKKAYQLREELSSLRQNVSTSIRNLSASSAVRVGLALDKVEVNIQTLRQGVDRKFNQLVVQQRGTKNPKNSQLQLHNSHRPIEQPLAPVCSRNPLVIAATDNLHSRLSLYLPSMAIYPFAISVRQDSGVGGDGFQRSSIGDEEMHREQIYGQPTAGLSVARIRPHTSAIFAFAESGNTDAMKQLFDQGLASPFDVSAQTGDQPLHIAADHGFIHTSRLLVAYGADPHEYDTGHRNTPHRNAWNSILSANISMKAQSQLSALFANVQASFDFPKLHQLVLNLRPGDLQIELERSRANIDICDSAGNTALLWACRRGDESATRLLLENGANPNIPNLCYGRTPLMAACIQPSLPCLKLLLQYGAMINAQNLSGLDALIYLVEEDRDPQPVVKIAECARLLIAHGISLEPHGDNKTWCLARAARNEMIDAMEIMLHNGANINSYCMGGYCLTALARSIDWGATCSVEFLLRKGAAYHGNIGIDVDGRNILHHAALYPKLDVINVLIDAKLVELDPDSVDNHGFTPYDYIRQSDNTGKGVEPAFKHLLADLRARNDNRTSTTENLTKPTEDEEKDIFYDAMDSQFLDNRFSK